MYFVTIDIFFCFSNKKFPFYFPFFFLTFFILFFFLLVFSFLFFPLFSFVYFLFFSFLFFLFLAVYVGIVPSREKPSRVPDCWRAQLPHLLSARRGGRRKSRSEGQADARRLRSLRLSEPVRRHEDRGAGRGGTCERPTPFVLTFKKYIRMGIFFYCIYCIPHI